MHSQAGAKKKCPRVRLEYGGPYLNLLAILKHVDKRLDEHC